MTAKEDIVREAVKSSTNHRSRRILAVVLVVALLSLVMAGVAATYAYLAVQSAAQSGVSLAEDVRTQCDTSTAFASQNPDLCGTATEVVDDAPASLQGAKGDPGDPGVPGEPGPPPSDAQVANAVALYCSGGNCNGADGRNATPNQVASAVALYCDSNGQCRGPEGQTGQDGQDGATGAQGPPPSAEQVQASVATYCAARNNCQGPTGPQGETGATGETGVVDVNSDCDAPEGMDIDKVQASYNRDTRTINFTCTYTDATAAPVDPAQ